jgi:hypothetical protein
MYLRRFGGDDGPAAAWLGETKIEQVTARRQSAALNPEEPPFGKGEGSSGSRS